MTIQTMRGTQARIRTSMHGSGRDHWHLIVSTNTGLSGATVARAFETRAAATEKALATRDAYTGAGYRCREIRNGSILEVVAPDAVRFLFVRQCNLRHSR